jgi:hypothetical protein
MAVLAVFFIVISGFFAGHALAGPCRYTRSDCPQCASGGLSLTGSQVSGDLQDKLVCTYGNEGAMNYVVMDITCQYDESTAQQNYDNLVARTQQGHQPSERLSGVSDLSNPGTTPSWKAATRTTTYAVNGASLAVITSTLAYDPGTTSQEREATFQQAREQNHDRAQKYADCFAASSFAGTGGTVAAAGSSPAVSGGALPASLQIDGGGIIGALSASIIPAVIGAIGALLGSAIGLCALFPGGFSWPGRDGGEGGTEELGGGVTWDDEKTSGGEEAINLQATGTGPGSFSSLDRGTLANITDPAVRERLREWFRNQVYQLGHWFVTPDGKNLASDFQVPADPSMKYPEIPIDEFLIDERLSTLVPSELHRRMAAQAAMQVPIEDIEKLRTSRWRTLRYSERIDLLRKLVPPFGAPIHAEGATMDVWQPVRADGSPNPPMDGFTVAWQYRVKNGPGDYESHIELNPASPEWTGQSAFGAVAILGHELKHTQQGLPVDIEGTSKEDIEQRGLVVRQSYGSFTHPEIDPSRYAANYVERDAESYGRNLALAIRERIRHDPETRRELRELIAKNKAGSAPPAGGP